MIMNGFLVKMFFHKNALVVLVKACRDGTLCTNTYSRFVEKELFVPIRRFVEKGLFVPIRIVGL